MSERLRNVLSCTQEMYTQPNICTDNTELKTITDFWYPYNNPTFGVLADQSYFKMWNEKQIFSKEDFQVEFAIKTPTVYK